MRRLACLETVSIISVLVACFVSAASAQTTYTITDLGTLPGGSGSSATAINASGQVTGRADTAGGYPHAYLYSQGTMTDLGTLGGCCSQGNGINDTGQVTGSANLTGDSTSHAFLYSAGAMTDLGNVITLGGSYSVGAGINDSGQITGTATLPGDTVTHAFLYSGGTMHDLGTLPGGTNSNGYGINASGQVTGQSDNGMNNQVILYSNGVMTDLGTILFNGAPMITNYTGLAINASGQIAGLFECASGLSCGDSGEQALLYSGGKLSGLGGLGAGGTESYGEAINASGQVVGWSMGSPLVPSWLQSAFVYSAATGMVDLNALIPANSGWTLTDASGINDAGQIAGTGFVPNSPPHAYLLTPVPITGPAPASGTTCNGTYNGTFTGNLNVSAGQNCSFVAGGVNGNVQVTGGNLSLSNATVKGNVQIQGDPFAIGTSTTINGNLIIQNLKPGTTQNQVCGTTVHGNLQFQNNRSPVQIGAASSCAGNTVRGNLQVQNNSAATTVVGNTVNGNLQDLSNTGATQVSNNVVGGNLQCQSDSSITGSGNRASRKQGQCASF